MGSFKNIEHLVSRGYISFFVSHGCCNKLWQTQWLQTIEIYCHSFGGQNSNVSVNGLRSKSHQVCTPSEGSRRELHLCLYQVLVASIPLLMASTLQPLPLSSRHFSSICVSSSLLPISNLPLPLSCKTLHLGSSLIIQDNLPISNFST